MLVSLGCTVDTADDGQEAIERLLECDDGTGNSSIDLIFMDQSMPRKDGLTATREIRALEAQGKLSRKRPIIALTAVVSSEAQNLFKEAGADDFLAKPLSLDRLKETLLRYLPQP
jgi:CheY-like chemotaxis protein